LKLEKMKQKTDEEKRKTRKTGETRETSQKLINKKNQTRKI
jgi:hypothetical protein